MSSCILWEEKFALNVAKEFFMRSNLMHFSMKFTLQDSYGITSCGI
jgi:hypothetical protein